MEQDKTKEKFISNVNKMADRRKQIEQIYDGSDESLRRIFNRASGASGGSRYNETTLQQILNQVGTENINKNDVFTISNYAYATDPTFSGIIDYLSNIFLWRYYYFPVQVKETAKDSDYEEIYNLMTEVADGLVLEVTIPTILTKLFKEGAVYIYAMRNRPSKTVSLMVLNSAYCRPVMMSQYGTGVFQFNLKYFDDLGFRGEELLQVLEYFPDELVSAYNEYKSGGPQFFMPDGRTSTYLSVNDFGFPTYLNTLKSVFDYNRYRANEVERNTAQLDRIMTHKIPSYENRLLFELSEVRALHKSMSRSLANNSRTRLITTFGDVEIHPMQEAAKFSTETLQKAQEAIYRTSGINSDMFMGKTKESLEVSLTRDQSIVWKYIQQIMNFYNLTINNLYNFRGYQIELTMLPITHYNLKEMMENHRRNGEYGIGRLEAIVASGTKQRHIAHKSKLEKFLKLDDVLTPLASAHTQPAQAAPEVKENKEEDGDDPETKPNSNSSEDDSNASEE